MRATPAAASEDVHDTTGPVVIPPRTPTGPGAPTPTRSEETHECYRRGPA